MPDKRAKNTHGIRAGLVPQWQPIDTAPRDDSVELLLWCKPHRSSIGSVQIGSYWFPSPENDQRSGWHSPKGYFLDAPTHWRPLPEPPQEDEVCAPKRVAIVSVEATGDMTGPYFHAFVAPLDTHPNNAGHKYIREKEIVDKMAEALRKALGDVEARNDCDLADDTKVKAHHALAAYEEATK